MWSANLMPSPGAAGAANMLMRCSFSSGGVSSRCVEQACPGRGELGEVVGPNRGVLFPEGLELLATGGGGDGVFEGGDRGVGSGRRLGGRGGFGVRRSDEVGALEAEVLARAPAADLRGEPDALSAGGQVDGH